MLCRVSILAAVLMAIVAHVEADVGVTRSLKKGKGSKSSKKSKSQTGECYLFDFTATDVASVPLSNPYICAEVYRGIVPSNGDMVLIDTSGCTGDQLQQSSMEYLVEKNSGVTASGKTYSAYGYPQHFSVCNKCRRKECRGRGSMVLRVE